MKMQLLVTENKTCLIQNVGSDWSTWLSYFFFLTSMEKYLGALGPCQNQKTRVL